jgi:hypothetical protein
VPAALAAHHHCPFSEHVHPSLIHNGYLAAGSLRGIITEADRELAWLLGDSLVEADAAKGFARRVSDEGRSLRVNLGVAVDEPRLSIAEFLVPLSGLSRLKVELPSTLMQNAVLCELFRTFGTSFLSFVHRREIAHQ